MPQVFILFTYLFWKGNKIASKGHKNTCHTKYLPSENDALGLGKQLSCRPLTWHIQSSGLIPSIKKINKEILHCHTNPLLCDGLALYFCSNDYFNLAKCTQKADRQSLKTEFMDLSLKS